MQSRRNFLKTALCAMPAIVVPLGAARATDWLPDRPIRLVVPYVAGGATDIAGRILTEAISGPLKQPMVIEN